MIPKKKRTLHLLAAFVLFIFFKTPLQAITITLKDNQSVPISKEQFELLEKNSVTIKNMIEDSGSATDFMLPEITNDDFELILAFFAHNKNPLTQKNFFEQKSLEELYSLAGAANFLDSDHLLDTILNAIASRIITIINKNNLAKSTQLFQIPLPLEFQQLLTKKLVPLADSLSLGLSKQMAISSEPLLKDFSFEKLKLAVVKPKYAGIETTEGTAFIFDLEKQKGTKFTLHRSIELIDISSNGKILTFVKSNGEIRTYDPIEKKSINDLSITLNKKTLPSSTLKPFSGIATDEEKKTIAITAEDFTAHVFSLHDKQSYTLDLKKNAPLCVSLHPNKGEMVAALGISDGSVVVWNYLTNEQRQEKVTKKQVNALLYSKDGSVIFIGSDKGEIIACKADTLTIINTIYLTNSVTCMALSKDGNYLVVGHKDNCTIIRTATLSPLYQLSLLKEARIFSLSFSPDDSEIFAAQSLHLKKRTPPLRKWMISDFKKNENSLLSLNFQQLLLFLLVREKGLKIIEKKQELLEVIYQSLSDEQKKLLNLLKK
jgi:WD40 repeat protein